MAVFPSTLAPSPPGLTALGLENGALQQRWTHGRLWIGKFLVPEHPFLLHAPCPVCGGACFSDEGDFRCLLCARSLLVAQVTDDGRVVALSEERSTAPVLVRVGTGSKRWTNRRLSKVEGKTGLCARVLRLVPRGEHQYVVVETLATQLHVHRDEIRGALDELLQQGLVARVSLASGYRTGWRRTGER